MSHDRAEVAAGLLAADDPAIRWKTRVHALGEDATSPELRALAHEVADSPRVRTLLAHRDADGRITSGASPYAKWQGAHWILATLADIGYPVGDPALAPVRDQILDMWLGPEFYNEFEATTKAEAYKRRGVPIMDGRYRRCASQQGYPLYFLLRLGLETDRVHDLVERLLHWRWPDGGWNCDKDPGAHKSTFIHTIHTMRGLSLYSERYADAAARAVVDEAAEIFLTRELFHHQADPTPLAAEFVKLHYPLYWHYDILYGLKVMAETGHLAEARCDAALDLLESKELAGGGWPAESRYYKVSPKIELGADFVDWGGTSKRKANPWVSADALAVLRRAGRWSP